MRLGQPTDEILDRICDGFWHSDRTEQSGVFIADMYQINAANAVASGTIRDDDGEVYGFIVESGDRNGTVVREWGSPAEVGIYNPPDPGEALTFIPQAPITPLKARIYRLWRKEPWFEEKARAYLYDRTFQPGSFVETHYAAWAAQRGMIIGLLSEFERAAAKGQGE